MDFQPLQPVDAIDAFPTDVEDGLAARFLDHVADAAFPCVGAKAALNRGAMRIREFRALGCPRDAAQLVDALASFADVVDATDDDSTLRTFVAVFETPERTDEATFDRLLWAHLQQLHDIDRARGNAWADDVATDPDDPRFSLSIAGHPFFVIGLHPGASRIARRFERPALVFNSHRQFDRLRADGRYARMQAATRARDVALQGSTNPNLADFGTAAETRQYSGRAVEPDWRCPLHIRTGKPH
ncbi:guanitoxin biosynthesis heme-dependent pre-guanitoxin N-hydroxylase GntA [Lysobacter claricitrinus]|uniref:guanitoxin biosynthesis heme-dependent pre-guanitoxin N-hydroxylase GntA n=1 Tax=Lysobacter claricitrinus TaxID=3367728 RepID=UPI0037DB42DE